MQNGTNWSPRICLFGDFGLENHNHSLPRMLQEQEKRMYDAIFHVGKNFFPEVHHMSRLARNSVSGVSDQVRHNPGCTATEDG